MKILITGADGQLGRALQKQTNEGVELIPLGIDKCDVTNQRTVDTLFDELRPDAVIHCAAYTAVDRAERDPEQCRMVNVYGTENVAEACVQFHSALMLLSTDYVFDGKSQIPYETESVRNALNNYGRSKIAAEDVAGGVPEHYIVRTSWMFGDGDNFVKTVVQAGRKLEKLDVVDDQIGSPTYSEDLAPALLKILSEQAFGTYHITNEGFCSWADLAEESFRLMGFQTSVARVTSEQYNSPAKRPHNSRLSKVSLDKAGIGRLPHWKDALRRYITKYRGSL